MLILKQSNRYWSNSTHMNLRLIENIFCIHCFVVRSIVDFLIIPIYSSINVRFININYAVSTSRLRLNKNKVKVMRNYPSLTNEELENFIYLPVDLRRFIPGRAELIRIMKLAILTDQLDRKRRTNNYK
jgi:hypothetical protein